MADYEDDEEDDSLDAIFAKAQREIREIGSLARPPRNKHPHQTEEEERDEKELNEYYAKPVVLTKFSENLKLYQVCTLKKWEKVNENDRNTVIGEGNVKDTDQIMEGIMNVPPAKRKITTAGHFFRNRIEAGLFTDLQATQLFTVEETGDQYLLCATFCRRINVRAILTGNYVFQITEPYIYKEADLDRRCKREPGVCKIQTDALEILTLPAVFCNFFFDVIMHPAADPMLAIEFL